MAWCALWRDFVGVWVRDYCTGKADSASPAKNAKHVTAL
jgi:hypothetical protein